MTVTEFLEARIAEDEAEAQKGGYHNASDGVFARDNYGCLLVQPSRVLAECTAKRAVIAAALDDANSIDLELACCHSVEKLRDNLCPVNEPGPVAIRALAAVYSDHPDYDKDWAL